MGQNGMYALKHFCYITKKDCHEKKHSSHCSSCKDELMTNIYAFQTWVFVHLKNEQSESVSSRKAIGSICCQYNSSFQGQIRTLKNSYLPL